MALWFGVLAGFVSVVTFAALAWLVTSPLTALGALLGVGVSLLWLVTMALAGALMSQRTGYAALSLLAAGVVVLGGLLQPGALVAGLLLLALLFGARGVLQQDQRERITPARWRAFVPGSKLLATGLVLVIAGLSLAPLERSLDASGLRVSEAAVGSILRPLEPVLSGLLPGQVTPDTTLETVIEQQIQAQLPPGVTPSAADRAQLEAAIAEQLSLTPALADPAQHSITALATEYLNATLQQFTAGRSLLVAFILVVVALLAARVLITPVAWLAAWLTIAALAVALKAGWLTKTTEQVTIERLAL